MHIVSTNFAKRLIWKHEYDVKLWRHKQRTPNTNDHHMPLNENPPWKFSAYATDYCSFLSQFTLRALETALLATTTFASTPIGSAMEWITVEMGRTKRIAVGCFLHKTMWCWNLNYFRRLPEERISVFANLIISKCSFIHSSAVTAAYMMNEAREDYLVTFKIFTIFMNPFL